MIREFIQRYFKPSPTGDPPQVVGFVIEALAAVWRRLLFRTTFIAITGSLGKTTAKECLAGLLASQAPTVSSWRTQNSGAGVAGSILRARPWHRFAVIELGAYTAGELAKASRLVRPHIAVVLNVARTHTDQFQSLEDTAAEKAGIFAGVGPAGTVLLNGDDPLVRQMAGKTERAVRFFGTSDDLDFRADQVTAGWPDRLRFRFHDGNESIMVKTPYVGTHWVPSVLAALAAARVCGLKLADIPASLAQARPFDARVEPVTMPNGVIFLRDEYNGSIDSFVPALEVMRTARARRRVLVVSDLSDSKKRRRQRAGFLGREAAEVAEAAVFVGESATHAERAATEAGMAEENVHAFAALGDASEFLKTFLQPGDLVLLKGRATHHLSRLFFAQLGAVDCWKPVCSKNMLCDICRELGPAGKMKDQAPPVPATWESAEGSLPPGHAAEA
ncbi:MAG: Mur ligase family protein [Acidobacteria bacterium]|nr:Mur ligase family protein [Acidobacteriota bacterium]